MMNWFKRVMAGRYGSDHLNVLLCAVAVLIDLIGIFVRVRWLTYISLVAIIIAIWRMFSKNISKRYAENQKLLSIWRKLTGRAKAAGGEMKDKDHRYYSCPQCGQRVRVPVGRGKIKITCPNCGNAFIKKT